MAGVTDIGGLPVIQTGGGGMNDNSWLGMLLVIALLGGGGGLLGNNAAGAQQGVTNDFLYSALNTNMGQGFANVSTDMNYSNLLQGQFNLSRDILNQTSTLDNTLQNQTLKFLDGFQNLNNSVNNIGTQNLLGQKDIQNVVQSGFATAAAQSAQCCCDTLRAIDGVNFNAAQNTAAINHNISDGFCQVNFNNERNTNAVIQNATANTQRIIDWLACNELKEANAKIAEQNQALSEARIIAAMKPVAPIPSYVVSNPYTGICQGGVPFGY